MKSALKKRKIRIFSVSAIVIVIVVAALVKLNIEPSDYRGYIKQQILQAKEVYSDNHENVGNKKGQYSAYTLADFRNDIIAAEEVMNDKESDYQTQKECYKTIKSKIKAFKTGQNEKVLTKKDIKKIVSEKSTTSEKISLSNGRSVAWKLDGDSMTDPMDLNLSVQEEGPFYECLSSYIASFSMDAVTLAFYHDGKMPGSMQIEMAVDRDISFDKEAFIYYLDETDHTLSFATEGTLTNQTLNFTVSKGGSYLILPKEISSYATETELTALAQEITGPVDEEELDRVVASVAKQEGNGDSSETSSKSSNTKKDSKSEDNTINDDQTQNDESESTSSSSTNSATRRRGSNNVTKKGSTSKDTSNKKTTTTKNDSNNNSTSNTNSNTSDAATKKDTDITVTLEIRCDTLVKNPDKLKDSSLKAYVPSSGTILAKTSYKCAENTTVYDVLYNVCRNKNIQMDSEYTAMYGSRYIKGINHLYEFNAGAYSGWLYKVNGEFPDYGCSDYQLEDGDEIVWAYTCSQGDVRGSGL